MRRSTQWLIMCLAVAIPCTTLAGEVVKGIYGDGITLSIAIEPFNAQSHTIKKCGDSICLIDGKPFFGSDGALPQHTVSRLVFEKNGKQTDLDVSSMYDPIINSENVKASVSVAPYWGDAYKVTGYFSDGAGAYVCQWLVVAGGSIRIHISNFEELLDLTSKTKKNFSP